MWRRSKVSSLRFVLREFDAVSARVCSRSLASMQCSRRACDARDGAADAQPLSQGARFARFGRAARESAEPSFLRGAREALQMNGRCRARVQRLDRRLAVRVDVRDGLPSGRSRRGFERTNARTRRILASAVRVTALILHAEAFPAGLFAALRPARWCCYAFCSCVSHDAPGSPRCPS